MYNWIHFELVCVYILTAFISPLNWRLTTSFLTIFQVGKLSTGDSLDMTPHDEASILANDAVIKDMEVGNILPLLLSWNHSFLQFVC